MNGSTARFEENAEKRLSNIEKHGIDFRRALRGFSDTRRVSYSSREEHAEQRSVLVALADNRLIAVIYKQRISGIRIISARPANRKERKLWNTSGS